jgi:hypothetical protein
MKLFISPSLSTLQPLAIAKMKWALRLVSRKKRTPVPPRPYVDTVNPIKEMTDPRTHQGDVTPFLDPEKPHWKDPKFESREHIPYIDFFGYNRDWSWTMFKIATIMFLVIMVHEFWAFFGLGKDAMRMTGTSVQATPTFAKNERATEKELRDAGFAYVGTKAYENIGAFKEEQRAKSF